MSLPSWEAASPNSGDEFAVILTALGSDAPTERLTDKVVQAARTAVPLLGCDVSASVGIAL